MKDLKQEQHFCKMFDKFWNEGLIYKLHHCGLSVNLSTVKCRNPGHPHYSSGILLKKSRRDHLFVCASTLTFSYLKTLRTIK